MAHYHKCLLSTSKIISFRVFPCIYFCFSLHFLHFLNIFHTFGLLHIFIVPYPIQDNCIQVFPTTAYISLSFFILHWLITFPLETLQTCLSIFHLPFLILFLSNSLQQHAYKFPQDSEIKRTAVFSSKTQLSSQNEVKGCHLRRASESTLHCCRHHSSFSHLQLFIFVYNVHSLMLASSDCLWYC